MRPMTNDVNILKGMLKQTGDQRLVRTLRLVKKFKRNAKRAKYRSPLHTSDFETLLTDNSHPGENHG